MAIHAFARPMSVDEAVDAVYRSALEGAAVVDAARQYAPQIDDRDIYELVTAGLIAKVHDRLSRQRRAQDGAEHGFEIDTGAGPAPAKARPHAAKEGWVMLKANYEAADGTRKSLLTFSIDDWRHLRGVAGGRAAGWIRVRDAADRAISALQQHGVATTAALPSVEKRAISGRLA